MSESERLSSRMGALADEVRSSLAASNASMAELRPGLLVTRVVEPMPRQAVVYPGALCIVAQGSKRAYHREQTWVYDAGHFLLSTMDIPAETEIANASPTSPMLSIVVTLDPRCIAAVAAKAPSAVGQGRAAASTAPSDSPFATHRISDALADTLKRLIRAASDDAEWDFLNESLYRELYFRLLRSDAAAMLLGRVQQAGSLGQVSKAIEFIKGNLTSPLDIEQIAKEAGLSASGLHQKFKRTTALSPMQFVKRLRLDRARVLLVSGDTVTEAAFKVGYSSPSQFSREYKRQYGSPPSSAATMEYDSLRP